ncbi:hypothetical protein KTH89_19045 [Lachnospiraceae bacterium ASD5720]|uniref:Uncharacterized protein n=1 Tax=Diplocloster agilis TaxID=2850323 RepID=A0A949K864_9FIRM|nr:hypothetical protein [Diplocloster agilis]
MSKYVEGFLPQKILLLPSSRTVERSIKQNGRKINYYDFLTRMEYEDCNQAIRRIVPKIDKEKIRAFLREVPYICELQKEFYGRYIEARRDKILKPVFDMISS